MRIMLSVSQATAILDKLAHRERITDDERKAIDEYANRYKK